MLSPLERFTVVDDCWAGVLAGTTPAAEFLACARLLGAERELVVWRGLGAHLRTAGRLVAGAALDVYETEPLPKDHVLWTMPNVLLTPHTAGFGPHLNERRYQIILDNCRAMVRGKPLRIGLTQLAQIELEPHVPEQRHLHLGTQRMADHDMALLDARRVL